MNALDTNVLVRFLVNDDEKQAQQAHKLFKQIEANHSTLLVPSVVVLELIWVLESAYKLSRAEILEALDDLLLMPILQFEHTNAIKDMLLEAASINADLSDLLIAHCAKANGIQNIFTFDRKTLQSSLFQKLPT